MPRHPTISDDDLLGRLTVLFRTAGYGEASMARIAAATGLEKSSLYHRFPNGKQQMAEEVTLHVYAHFATVVLAAAGTPGTPHERLRLIASALSEFYDGGRRPCILEALSVEPVNSTITTNLATATDAWIEVFAALSVEAGIPRPAARERAEDAIARIEGALVMARVTGDTTPFERALRELPVMLTTNTAHHDDSRTTP